LYSFQKINNVELKLTASIFFFIKKNCGTSLFFLKKIKERFEFSKNLSFQDLTNEQYIAFLYLLKKIFPEKLFYKNYILLNIIFLDFNCSYRG
jgi:hypothetical protein